MSVHNLRFPLTMYASLPRAFPFLSRAPWSSNCSRFGVGFSIPIREAVSHPVRNLGNPGTEKRSASRSSRYSFRLRFASTRHRQPASPIGVQLSLSSFSMPSVQHGSRYQCAIPLCEIVK